MLHFNLVTLFPEFFESPLQVSLLGRAQKSGILSFSFHNPREYSDNKHRHVDDRPYGGGPGMVMQGKPLMDTLQSIPNPGRILLMSPSGKPFSQSCARDLAQDSSITIICGRYEGIDARLLQTFPIDPVCYGDAVLNGGETAALAVIEAVSRLRPGFMGKLDSGNDESFSAGVLEHPHYTRPEELNGLKVPDVLLKGNHEQIAAWRRRESLRTTLEMRPELLDTATLHATDIEHLQSLQRRRYSHNLHFCLLHHPVMLDKKESGTSSLTNLDVHDIARISKSYGMGKFYVVSPLEEQLLILQQLLRHWLEREQFGSDRASALETVFPAASFETVVSDVRQETGLMPKILACSAKFPSKKYRKEVLNPQQVLQLCHEGPVVFCLGTAQGLTTDFLGKCDAQVRPIRFLGYNHLSVRSAAAIFADRILGDFF